MATLHQEMLNDMAEIQYDTGSPTFVWSTDGNTYPCIASVAQFNRDLVEGGFTVEQMLTLTVPRYDSTGTATFPNDVIPQAQQRVVFNNKPYRIESVKEDSVNDYDSSGASTSNGARIRIVAVGTVKGF